MTKLEKSAIEAFKGDQCTLRLEPYHMASVGFLRFSAL